MNDLLRAKLSLLPESPGVYRYYDREGTIIYVGKAKNLRRRVNSYFNREHSVSRTARLVSHIEDVQYTVVNNEEEALDLENNLIKEYKPRYNVLLKDDKSYPWIAITKELYPRVYITRERLHRGAWFYGPYPKSEVAHALIDTVRQLFPIRTCRLAVSRETIEAKKHRLCLQFHIKNCEGCCHGLVTDEQYAQYIEQIKRILTGETRLVADYLQSQMMTAAQELRFEDAEVYKRRLQLVEKIRAKSTIVSPTLHNIDVYGVHRDDDDIYIGYLHVRNGSVVQSLTLEYHLNKTEDTETDVLPLAIAEVKDIIARSGATSDRVKEILVNVLPDTVIDGVEFVIPQRGDKRKLLDIALKNAEQRKIDRLKLQEKLNPEQRATRLVTSMQRDLHLTVLPRHIECFDNSNIQGSDAVASCVVFRNGKPSKKEYRHYNIKTVDGPDDFATMREVITRRYSRLLSEGDELPQLIVVDGGKGQLSAAVESLELLGLEIPVVGLAKRMDEVFFPGDSLPYNLEKNSETIKVLQHVRDESHRFAITFHRKQRSKSQINSELTSIPGVGAKSVEQLLRHFKSVKRMREASLDDIAAIVGPARATKVLEYFTAKK